MARIEGYYWVRVWEVGAFPELKQTPGSFQVAYWNGRSWYFCGDNNDYPDTSLYSITSRLIDKPNEGEGPPVPGTPTSGPGEGVTPLNPYPLPPKPDGSAAFPEWRAELIRVIARATGQSEAVIKINDIEAEKWYRDGFTAYQCFRETYDMENDSGV